MIPSTSAGYAESVTSAPATSTIPRTPTASADSAIVNQNRIGPRLRGFGGGGGTKVGYAGTVAGAPGDGAAAGGAGGAGCRWESPRTARTISTITPPTIASGQGKPQSPAESPMTARAASAPTR